jgi:polyisoprenoid-binding protein YceI
MELRSGTLTIHTDVAGSAARMGHRLAIAVKDWSVTVTTADDDDPVAVEFRADLPSMRVESGSGGLTPLTPVDKQVVVRNAAKTLDSKKYPDVTFRSAAVARDGDVVHVEGDLTIHGVTQRLAAQVALEDGRARASVPVRQTDFGIKPYSLMLGQLKVADEVVVTLDVELPA